jgi:hypothetical protein
VLELCRLQPGVCGNSAIEGETTRVGAVVAYARILYSTVYSGSFRRTLLSYIVPLGYIGWTGHDSRPAYVECRLAGLYEEENHRV